MNYLAIETSTNICSVALFMNDTLILSKEINTPRSHSKELGRLIEQLFIESNLKINIIDFIALSSGPGSFTGLRIGSSLAKGIVYALELPIVMVPTLITLESKIEILEQHCIGIYSHKDQVYKQDFENNKPISKIELISVDQLNNNRLYGFELEKANSSLSYIEIKPSAELVGELARQNYNKWLVTDLSEAKLNYITNLNIHKK